ncbi:MAG: diguanylate cyclase [Firmicutes bacterium]|nr:diguanylate cyclase [Bacillota bacterium]MCL5040565.1 diguanylate cyclase [Bacillota bacterium]
MAGKDDELTGLPDRHQLQLDLDAAAAAGEGLALAMLDVDNFLEINTEFGYEVGDRALRTLSELFQEAQLGGQFYRVAGDEFAALFPGRSLEQAFLEMEAFRRDVEMARERFAFPERRLFTVTIGLAHYPRDTREPKGVFKLAEAALFAAKEAGGNRVALPPTEEMVMKSCYYPGTSIRRLKQVAERLGRKESGLLREALDDLLRKYDRPPT